MDNMNFDTRPSLIQPELAHAVTEDAIHRSTFLTSEERKQIYYEGIEEAARRHRILTADEIWDALGQVGDGERDNGSGIGSVIRVAVDDHIMKPTGEFRRSRRPATHKKPIPVYESLIWRGLAQEPVSN